MYMSEQETGGQPSHSYRTDKTWRGKFCNVTPEGRDLFMQFSDSNLSCEPQTAYLERLRVREKQKLEWAPCESAAGGQGTHLFHRRTYHNDQKANRGNNAGYDRGSLGCVCRCHAHNGHDGHNRTPNRRGLCWSAVHVAHHDVCPKPLEIRPAHHIFCNTSVWDAWSWRFCWRSSISCSCLPQLSLTSLATSFHHRRRHFQDPLPAEWVQLVR